MRSPRVKRSPACISMLWYVAPSAPRRRIISSATSLAVTPGRRSPVKVTFTLSGTFSQVLPLAAARAMSVAPMPLPNAATAP